MSLAVLAISRAFMAEFFFIIEIISGEALTDKQFVYGKKFPTTQRTTGLCHPKLILNQVKEALITTLFLRTAEVTCRQFLDTFQVSLVSSYQYSCKLNKLDVYLRVLT